MRRNLLAALLPLALAPVAHADSLDVKLNDSMAEFLYATDAENLGLSDGDVAAGFLFNENDDLVGSLSFQSVGRMDNSVSFSLGVKSYAMRIDAPDESLLSFALGGGVGYTFPNTPVTASVAGFIAPDILTFGDASGVREWNARLQAQLLPNAAVFIGWRELRSRLDDWGSHMVDDDFHVGVKIGF